MRARSAIAMLVMAGALGVAGRAAGETYEIGPELWDRPRTAATILGNDNVKRAVNALIARADAQLVIHHAPAQEPLVQAEELRAWLAALAVDARRVRLRNDLPTGAPLKLEVAP